MDKLNMQTTNIVDENIKRIGELFPNCLTERLNDEGKPEVAIDFDQLRQELSKDIVEGAEERYQFTWPDKRNAIRLANAPTTDTLRPCREESVDFDNTQNLYIEGDNLEVLKLLRENYLGKVKMIYIDPPYNTGNDFVYNDDFAQTTGEYIHNSGQEDEEGNRLVANTESNGRFHTDWLNMIYPRLKVAKDLLSEDGVIFISIDDNEVENLKKVCDEIFGSSNFVAQFSWQKVYSPKNNNTGISSEVEYIISYSKRPNWMAGKLDRTKEMDSIYKNPDNDPNGDWTSSDASAPGAATHQGMVYGIQSPFTGEFIYPTRGRCWQTYQDDLFKIMNGWASYKMEDIHDEEKRASVCGIDVNKIRKGVKSFVLTEPLINAKVMAEKVMEKEVWPIFYFTGNGQGGIRKKTYLKDMDGRSATNLWKFDEVGHNDEAKKEVASLFDGFAPFDTPKPIRLMMRLLKIGSKMDSIILDFFSGSATMAHSVMLSNEQDGGHRKFILVQIPEKVDNKYSNLCEIGKERIRRAGKKIKEESPLTTQDLDIGFRVLKLDSSNMQDVYYTPSEFNEQKLFDDNIKPDRTEEDLLFQTMIELGIALSAKIEKRSIAGKTVWSVSDSYLMACFDEEVNETTIIEIARQHPYYFVMRDSSLANDQVADNFEQIWEEYSKDTVRRII